MSNYSFVRRVLPIASALAVAVTGCDSHDPLTPDRSREQASSQIQTPSTSELTAIARFSIQLSVTGALKPGVPRIISCAVTAALPSKQAVISVAAPELVLVNARRWQQNRPAPGAGCIAGRDCNCGIAVGVASTWRSIAGRPISYA
ncbi:MAG: hypothetical protein ACT4P6_22130 [Gemmatimonadaceae bacterium]